jgi:GR25 family glycosyltransferase involved in LPS biosynthesis
VGAGLCHIAALKETALEKNACHEYTQTVNRTQNTVIPTAEPNAFDVQNWKAYYINLDTREDRRQSVEQELARVGIAAERFPACTDSDVSLYPEFVLGRRRNPGLFFRVLGINGRIPGELGCALSHYAIIKKHLASGSEKILAIFEDDVHLCADFPKRIHTLQEHCHLPWDIFYLGTFFPLKKAQRTAIPHILRLNKAAGAHAMLLNPRSLPTIMRLLQSTAHQAASMDNLYTLLTAHLSVLTSIPEMATQKNFAQRGDIGNRTNLTQCFFYRYGPHVFAETLEEYQHQLHHPLRHLFQHIIFEIRFFFLRAFRLFCIRIPRKLAQILGPKRNHH